MRRERDVCFDKKLRQEKEICRYRKKPQAQESSQPRVSKILPLLPFHNSHASSGPQTIVTVNVSSTDNETKPFQVHKNYICHYSPYFEAAFNGRFIEGETQVLDLDDTDPLVFGIFVNWLYTQTVVDEEGIFPSCSDCINLWILADRLLVPSLQNQSLAALDKARILYEGMKGKDLTDEIFQRVWTHTGVRSCLRMYLVKVIVELPARSRIGRPERYPHEMLVSIIHGMRRREERRIGRKAAAKYTWEPSDEDLKGYFVPEDVEDRKVVPAAPNPLVGNDSGFMDG